MTAGAKYSIRMEYFENRGGAAAQLRWASASTPKALIPTSQLYPATSTAPVGTGTGLRGEYYDNMDLTNLKVTRTDPTVSFDWASGSPTPPSPSTPSRCAGPARSRPSTARAYTFSTTTDDGVRLWVNDQLVIDKWVDQGPTERSGTIALTAGAKYSIRMEYFENGGGAAAQLRWASASTPKALIPTSQLYPATR